MREGSAKNNSYVKSRNGRTNINMEGQRSNAGHECEPSERFGLPDLLTAISCRNFAMCYRYVYRWV